MKMVKAMVLVGCICLLSGCVSGNQSSSDPTERGCSYIAAAISFSAVLRAFFNK